MTKVLHDLAIVLNWSNFKGAVKARKRHDTFMKVWSAMHAVQDR